MGRLPLAFYGDDFTGSADLLMQCQRLGMTGTILLGTPGAEAIEQAAQGYDVVGVAGVTRALPTERIVPIVEAMFAEFAKVAPRLVQYKVCSTADSSPTLGSFTPAIAAGRVRFGERPVPFLVAQPNLGRYTAFSNHFAVDGGQVYRLDRQPIMANHPATPMREADLRRHLELQLGEEVGGIHLTELRSPARLRQAYADAQAAGLPVVVMDAVEDADLVATGELLLEQEGTAFGVGSAGLSIGYARALGYTLDEAPTVPGPTALPCLAVSGSCSRLSREQLRHALERGWHGIAMDLQYPGSWSDHLTHIRDEATAELAAGRNVVVYTCGPEQEVADGGVDVEHVAGSFARLITAARERELIDRALIIGGDTSGQVVTALGARAMAGRAVVGDYRTLLFELGAPGSPNDGLQVVLKGGQIGDVDFFEVARLGTGAT